jgi:hypothetical protein
MRVCLFTRRAADCFNEVMRTTQVRVQGYLSGHTKPNVTNKDEHVKDFHPIMWEIVLE